MSMCLALVAILSLIASTLSTSSQSPLQSSTPQHLHITTILSHPDPPHHAYMQCLKITSSTFHTYPTVGQSLFLSNTTNTTLVVLPPRSEEGWHRPPAPMLFVLLRGRAVVQTPWTRDNVTIAAPSSLAHGDSGRVEPQMVLALDIAGNGHLTFYPGETETVALQIPLADGLGGLIWDVVREGPC